jgi:hypothetical protein
MLATVQLQVMAERLPNIYSRHVNRRLRVTFVSPLANIRLQRQSSLAGRTRSGPAAMA